MTTTISLPNDDDTKARQAMVRALTNQMNQAERHHRRNMTSQEELAHSARQAAKRSDQGHASILSMIDEVSDQIAEGHQVMATKADIETLRNQMNRIEEHLIKYDHIVIPRDQQEGSNA
jgi:hypothetical protein